MSKYKVEYIHTEKVKSKWYEQPRSAVDTWSLAKELEALLLEYEKLNYKVLSIEPILVPTPLQNGGGGTKTDGLMVVFEKEPNTLA